MAHQDGSRHVALDFAAAGAGKSIPSSHAGTGPGKGPPLPWPASNYKSQPLRASHSHAQVQEDLSPQASPSTGPTPVPTTVGAAVAAAQAQQAAAVKGGGISAVPAAGTTTATAPGAVLAHAAGAGPLVGEGAKGQPAVGRTQREPSVEYKSGPEVRCALACWACCA